MTDQPPTPPDRPEPRSQVSVEIVRAEPQAPAPQPERSRPQVADLPPAAQEALRDRWTPPPATPWPLRIAKLIAALAVIGVGALLIMNIAPRLAETVAADRGPTLAIGVEAPLEIPLGSSATRVAELVAETGVIGDAGAFEREIRIGGVADGLRAGEYTLVGGMTSEQILQMLVVGPPAADTYRVTVIEGLRIEEMLVSLGEQTEWDRSDFQDALISGNVASQYVRPSEDLPEDATALAGWEGVLFPSTYEFVESATPTEILQRMASELDTRMGRIDWGPLENRGLTPYDGLVMASLIEKEAKLDDDRPLIASVIMNRLDDGIGLQIDATVIYALGQNPGRVLFSDLEIESAWNTYKIAGLPPTPIGGVRQLSLEAAANPAETGFYYYVLIDLDGTHGFSETLDEHNERIAKARRDGVLP